MKLSIGAKLAVLILAVYIPIACTSGCGKKAPLSLFPLVDQKDLAEGKKLYDSRCALCHGQPDKGNLPRLPPLVSEPVLKGDTQELAYAILYERMHRTKNSGPYLFESMNDSDIAKVGNYLRDLVGEKNVPLRARTVQRAREIHAIRTGQPVGPSKNAPQPAPATPQPPAHPATMPDTLPSGDAK
jgi:mono/diheme cytochrome c family protein